jgi:uncharacterized protein
MKQQELVYKVKESIRKLDPRARVILFGSRARGDSKTNSDWDFLIISSLQVNEKLKRQFRTGLIDTELDAEEVISTIIYSKNEWNDYQFTPFYRNIAKEFWNGAANRLYYSCFYSVIALLAKDDIPASTHNGVRTEFFRRYIKTGIFSRDFSSLYTDLMGKRQESDYDDFHNFSEEDIMPLFAEAENFNKTILEFLRSGEKEIEKN